MQKISNKTITIIIFSIIIFSFFYYIPIDLLLNSEPATGGDTGSHFWPLQVLHDSWSKGDFRVKFWNPGNIGGEPLLVHYFPLCFMIMGALSFIIPIGTAFNLVTVLGCFSLPFSIYYMGKKCNFSWASSILSSILILLFLFNDSYSIYGGNFASTLAGQFSHSWSLCLFFLALGFLYEEFEKNIIPIKSILTFSMVALSHGYTFLSIPIAQLAILILFKSKRNLIRMIVVGISILLISAWFLVPMIENNFWGTPFIYKTRKYEILKIINSWYFWILAFSPLSLFFLFILNKKFSFKIKFLLPFLMLILFYVMMYYLFPEFGLVNGRVIPNLYPLLTIFIAILIGENVNLLKQNNQFAFIGLSLFIVLFVIFKNNNTLIHWSKWNYQSWSSKSLNKDFKEVTDFLKGDFNQPRVISESNEKINQAGTPRAFEMLPYFSNRSSGSGLYQQVNLTSPMFFYLQGLISRNPSCPFFTTHQCKSLFDDSIEDKSKLLGISELVSITNESKNLLNNKEYLSKVFSNKTWNIYSLKNAPKLVEILKKPISKSDNTKWKQEFYHWFKNYSEDTSFITTQDIPKVKLSKIKECNPNITTSFKGFTLNTNCLKSPHLIKFSYNDSFSTSDESKYYLISPGFILSFPESNTVEFTFGDKITWKLANIISIISILFLFLFSFLSNKKTQL